jgi:probable HAF family extracellular repeat protein
VGSYLGTYGSRTGFFGFVYSNGVFTTLADPLATGFDEPTVATGINDSGQIVGYYQNNSGVHGFLYDQGTYTTIADPLGFNFTRPFGINDAGEIVGDYFDGSGNTCGFLASPSTIPPASGPPPAFDLTWNPVGVGDFNLDGYADLAWQRQTDNLVEVQFLAGTGTVGGGAIANSPFDSSWSVVAAGDFNGDGHSDLVYRRMSDGLAEIQLLNGTVPSGGGAIANNPFGVGWSVVATGDFNGDGKSDLVWQRASDGLVEIQALNGSTAAGSGTIANNPFGAGWSVVATGDFNADRDSDLVWQNQSTGLVEIQFIQVGQQLPPSPFVRAVGGGAIAGSPFWRRLESGRGG